MATSHQGKAIPCSECSMEFASYSILKVHKSIYHSAENGAPNHQALLAKLQALAGWGPPSKQDTPLSPQASPAKVRKVEVPSVAPPPPPPPASLPSPVVKDEKILDLSAPPPQPPAHLHHQQQLKIAPLEDLMGPQHSSPRAPSKASTSVAPLDDLDSTIDEHEEELKDMKLKGEFPCRLCPLVYPNLRALKGHNKEHMNKAPYVCNVGQCTYSSNDKGTLVRHMRNHTGEKPFEVSWVFFYQTNSLQNAYLLYIVRKWNATKCPV